MKKYPLSQEKIHDLLTVEPVGRLASTGADGFPYITPVHFVFMEGKIVIHGLAVGEKLANIKRDPRVCFEVERMLGLIHDAEKPCDTNTTYESVIIRGHATVVADTDVKLAVLDAFVRKYTPQHSGKSYPEAMVKMTGIIELSIQSCTGKYYPA
ncbi:pyridoxamine 5'-phosphate oxidase family protein [Desulfovibrio sp. MES5]|uniref:pyridoxamine 5'-phosphate oxidase family protein n=1 Tax=Desulfovibrio sp. MES5 TaxID=1899016 RepID=UPI0025C1824F|nr:pyridoxamine 5'-phosphate oxidase family protein [Desulfovibrio sp. MES5]